MENQKNNCYICESDTGLWQKDGSSNGGKALCCSCMVSQGYAMMGYRKSLRKAIWKGRWIRFTNKIKNFLTFTFKGV